MYDRKVFLIELENPDMKFEIPISHTVVSLLINAFRAQWPPPMETRTMISSLHFSDFPDSVGRLHNVLYGAEMSNYVPNWAK